MAVAELEAVPCHPERRGVRVGERPGGVLVEEAVAEPGELGDYDAIIFGTPTRFGNMCAQMRNFLDQTGGLWVKGGLVGKVGSPDGQTMSQEPDAIYDEYGLSIQNIVDAVRATA